MTIVVATTAMVGLISGTVTRKKMLISLAPSTRAASSTSVGMLFERGGEDHHTEAGPDPDVDGDQGEVVDAWLLSHAWGGAELA